MGDHQDDIILVPITTLQKKSPAKIGCAGSWSPPLRVMPAYTAQEQITSLLRDRHRIRKGQDDDFMVRNLADMADLADQAHTL